MDARLLEILVCPLCKGPLQRLGGRSAADGSTQQAELVCNADRLAFPVRDGIPVMLVDEARKTDSPPAAAGSIALDEPRPPAPGHD